MTDDAPELSALIEKLSEMGAFTVDGKKVDAAQLKETLKGKNVAVSFGFQGCKGLCVDINQKHAVLEQVATQKDAFVSLVINVSPDSDNTSNDTRAAYVKDVVDAGNKAHPVIGIFPKSDKDAETLQEYIKLITIAAHSSMITLYDKQGQFIGRKDAMHNSADAFKEWGEKHLNKPAEKKAGMVNPLPEGAAWASTAQAFAANLITDSSDHLLTPAAKKIHGKTRTFAA